MPLIGGTMKGEPLKRLDNEAMKRGPYYCCSIEVPVYADTFDMDFIDLQHSYSPPVLRRLGQDD